MVKNSRETLDKRNKLKKAWFEKLKDTDFPKTVKRKCKKCGEHDSIVLTFHHVNPNEKDIEIGKLINSGYCFENETLQKELKKCVLLCFNCHMKEHRKDSDV